MLNPHPNAVKIIENLSIKTGRNVALGNKDSYKNDNVRRLIGLSHDATVASVDFIKRLAKDETRTQSDLHFRGKREADKLIATLISSRDGLHAEADKMEAASIADMESYFALDASRTLFHSFKIAWVKEQWGTEGGTLTISKTVKSDPELGALLFRSDAYLLNMPDEVRLNMVEKAVQVHIPTAHEGIETAKRVRKVADGYNGVINDVRSSFSIESVAERYEVLLPP